MTVNSWVVKIWQIESKSGFWRSPNPDQISDRWADPSTPNIFKMFDEVYGDVGDDDVDDGDDVDDDDVDDDDVDHDDVEVRAFGPRAGPQTTKRGELLCLKIYLCGECGHKF